jgi:hypothetical protein
MAGRITVSTLNDDTGVLATQNGMTGIAKAWVNFNGSSGTIRASFNVSSITVNGTGDYTVNFTTAFPNANYSFLGTASQASTGNNGEMVSILATTTPTTSLIQIRTQQDGIGVNNPTFVCAAVFSS